METGETCLYNKSIKNKHKEVYGMKKKMMMALMASMVLSTVLGAAGTAKADERSRSGIPGGRIFPGNQDRIPAIMTG